MHVPSILRPAAAAALALVATGCSLHSTATRWNGRTGPDGEPVFVRTTTNIGLNVGVILPVLGSTTIDEMIDESTLSIAEHGSDRVRVFQTTAENYWYGVPPLTWILTPVITEVSVEYRPSAAELAAVAAADAGFDRRQQERVQGDDRHVIPEPRR